MNFQLCSQRYFLRNIALGSRSINSFSSLEKYLFPINIYCEFLERVSQIMRHPRYCRAHHSGIFSNITNAAPLTPHRVAHQPLPRAIHNNANSIPFLKFKKGGSYFITKLTSRTVKTKSVL